MTAPELLEPQRAEPDYEAMDEVSQWAVEHAEQLALMDAERSKVIASVS